MFKQEKEVVNPQITDPIKETWPCGISSHFAARYPLLIIMPLQINAICSLNIHKKLK